MLNTQLIKELETMTLHEVGEYFKHQPHATVKMEGDLLVFNTGSWYENEEIINILRCHTIHKYNYVGSTRGRVFYFDTKPGEYKYRIIKERRE